MRVVRVVRVGVCVCVGWMGWNGFVCRAAAVNGGLAVYSGAANSKQRGG